MPRTAPSSDKRVFYTKKSDPAFVKSSCHAVRAGGFVFACGEGGRDPKTMQYGLTIEEQTEQAIKNIKNILEDAGTSIENVVKRTVYLQDRKDLYRAYRVIDKYFTSPCASTTVEVGLLGSSPTMLIEIDVTAVVPKNRKA